LISLEAFFIVSQAHRESSGYGVPSEWSALNYFRNDEKMFEIISSHEMYGDLLDWPYAGLEE